MPLSYDLTTFQILGQKFVKFFIDILVQTMTPKGDFEINRPLIETPDRNHNIGLIRKLVVIML